MLWWFRCQRNTGYGLFADMCNGWTIDTQNVSRNNWIPMLPETGVLIAVTMELSYWTCCKFLKSEKLAFWKSIAYLLFISFKRVYCIDLNREWNYREDWRESTRTCGKSLDDQRTSRNRKVTFNCQYHTETAVHWKLSCHFHTRLWKLEYFLWFDRSYLFVVWLWKNLERNRTLRGPSYLLRNSEFSEQADHNTIFAWRFLYI